MWRLSRGYGGETEMRDVSDLPKRCVRLFLSSLGAAALSIASAAPLAAADRIGLFQACRADYRRLCPDVQMGGGRILACLNQHAAELSPECRNGIKGLGAADPAAVPPGVVVERDLAYGPDPLQRLDVYRPERADNAPVLLMVHGGAWMIGDKALPSTVGNKVAHWLPKGVIIVSANYRLSPAADPREQARDVARALAFAQGKAREWGGDPSRFVLMGHSAGAHLVALLAADPGIAYGLGARPWLGTVSLDSGAVDLVAVMQGRHFFLHDRVFGSDPAYWRSVSPLERLTGKPQPMLLVCGHCENAQTFAKKSRAAGGRVQVMPVKLSHREINAGLGVDGEYTAAVDAFLRTLGLP